MEYNLENCYAMKSLVENLFGSSAWYEVKHSTDPKVWRKYSTRILSAISVSARATVSIADSEWHEELNSLVEFGQSRIKSSASTELIFANLAASLASISFHQLGLVPCNIRSKQVTLRHEGNWKLDCFRSVQYVQSKEQKATKERFNASRKKAPPEAIT